MGLFGNKPQAQEQPTYQASFLGCWIKVYSDRVEFRPNQMMWGSVTVPIKQIASVHTGMVGHWKITLETTGGKKYDIPTRKKDEIKKAIYEAQARLSKDNVQESGVANEISKLNDLKEKGIISQDEFDKKKKQLLEL